MKRQALPDRIDDLLRLNGSMSFYDLAFALYPDGKSWNYQKNGGPPGCFMAISSAIRCGNFPTTSRGVGPGHRIVHARDLSAMTSQECQT